MHEDEPVGYLGGEVGQNPYDDDDAYSTQDYADANPYGGTDEEEIAGYLEGAAGEEEVPMLPPAESQEYVPEESQYSAKDFIDSDPAMDSYDPYAEDDPYATSGEDYGYEGYDPAEVAQSDASYFDDMAHTEEPATQKYAEEYPEEEYEDDSDQPKTISQQDAESIIRRITTKRIVPPEAEARAPRPVVQHSLTPTGGGPRVWPLLLAFLILAGVAGYMFRNELGEQLYEAGFPEAASLLGYQHKEPVAIDTVKQTETREQKRRRIFKEMVLKSELKAFGLSEKDLKGKPSGKQAMPQPTGNKTSPTEGH